MPVTGPRSLYEMFKTEYSTETDLPDDLPSKPAVDRFKSEWEQQQKLRHAADNGNMAAEISNDVCGSVSN